MLMVNPDLAHLDIVQSVRQRLLDFEKRPDFCPPLCTFVTFVVSALDLLDKLLQEPDIPVEEQLNIVHAILQNRNPLHAHAEGEAADFLRIVIYEPINIRIHHAAAQQFNPAASLAVPARAAITISPPSAKNATDLHIRARLGERKK